MALGMRTLYYFLRKSISKLFRNFRQYARQLNALFEWSGIALEDGASWSYSAGPQIEQDGDNSAVVTTYSDLRCANIVAGQNTEIANNLVGWTLSTGNYDLDKPILIDAADPYRFVTKRKALKLVTSLTGAFEPDSTVCLHLPNDVLYPVLVLGILASGSIWTGTNVANTPFELEHHFRASCTKFVITLPEYEKAIETAAKGLGCEIEIILFADILKDNPSLSVPYEDPMRPNDGLYMHTNSSVEPVARKTLHDLLGNIDEGNLKRKIDSIEPDQIAVLQSTSGTTGLPKMAVRTHRALILESQAIEDNHSQKPHEVYRLFCTPIFHAFSTPEMVITPLRLGIPTYIMRRYDDTFAQKVHEYGITETAASPPMLNMLQERHTSHHLLQSLRMIFCGGAPLVRELRERTLAIFKTPPRIVQVWGMTEGGWFSTFKYPEDDTTGSVGRMVPGYEIKTSTDDPLEMTNGRKAGELLVKGPQLMTGYYGNEQASRDAFIDGWLKTGDIGYIEEGKVYLVDRSKDLIKVNGWQVAPAEIEAIVLELPEVKDAATIGIGYGVDERPLLFVESSHGKAVSNEDVVNHLRSKVAKHKIARIEVESIESIPRNPSGKILRKVLREKAIEVLRARARGVLDEGE